jgi:hypothetical protein
VPLCGALSLVLGALLGKGKTERRLRSSPERVSSARLPWGPWRGRRSHRDPICGAQSGLFPRNKTRLGDEVGTDEADLGSPNPLPPHLPTNTWYCQGGEEGAWLRGAWFVPHPRVLWGASPSASTGTPWSWGAG